MQPVLRRYVIETNYGTEIKLLHDPMKECSRYLRNWVKAGKPLSQAVFVYYPLRRHKQL